MIRLIQEKHQLVDSAGYLYCVILNVFFCVTGAQ